jgi:hypothetical protein
MQVNVRLYRNTGFNAENRPDGPLMVETYASNYTDLNSIFVVQNKGLSEIVVPLAYSLCSNIDYIRLESILPNNNTERVYYYATAQPEMINEQDTRIPIALDKVGTYGLSKNDFMSGIINVATVPVDDWRWASIPDNRVTPPGILKVKVEEVTPQKINPDLKHKAFSRSNLTLANLTVSPAETANTDSVDIKYGLIPGSVDKATLTVPIVKPPVAPTSFFMPVPAGENGYKFVEYTTQGYTTYVIEDTDNILFTGDEQTLQQKDLKATINKLRALNLQDTLLSQYNVDYTYINLKDVDYTGGGS